jgi:hypothetical protein
MVTSLTKKTTSSAQAAMAKAQPKKLSPTGVTRDSSVKIKIKTDKPIQPDKKFPYASPNA